MHANKIIIMKNEMKSNNKILSWIIFLNFIISQKNMKYTTFSEK